MVLSQNENVFFLTAVAHADRIKKNQESIKTLLEVTQYSDHNYDKCGFLKMIALSLGLQKGHTKYSCLLFLWNSIISSKNYRFPQGQILTSH